MEASELTPGTVYHISKGGRHIEWKFVEVWKIPPYLSDGRTRIRFKGINLVTKREIILKSLKGVKNAPVL